jgi:hypothetical protein
MGSRIGRSTNDLSCSEARQIERQTTQFSAEAQVAAADPSVSRCDPAARLVSFRQSC